MKATLVTVLIFVSATCAFSITGQNSDEYLLRHHPTYYKETDAIKKALILDEINTNGLTDSEHALFENEVVKLSDEAIKKGDKELMYYSDFLWSFMLIWKADYNNALSVLKKIENHYIEIEDKRKLGFIYRNKGICYNGKGLQKESLQAFGVSKAYFKECNIPMELIHGKALEANGWIYFKRYTEAEATITSCISFMTKRKKYNTVFRYYHMLANLYSAQNKQGEEKWANLKSYEFAVKSKNLTTQALAQNNLAIVKYYQGDLNESIRLFKGALESRIKTGKSRLICESYYNIASVYEELDVLEAKRYYHKSLDLAKRNSLYLDECDALLALAQLSKKEKDFITTVELLEKYNATKEKIQLEDTQDILDISKRLNTIEVETLKMNLSNELKEVKLQLNKNNKLLIILCVGYAVMLLFLLKKMFLTKMKI